MKKKIKILSVILSAMLLLFAFVGCSPADLWNTLFGDLHIHSTSIKHPEPSTYYTEEEQIERIIMRTKRRFVKEIEQGKIIDYQVEIVYSFDNKPEFFLVQLYYDPINLFELEYRNYAYIIGFMNDDKLQTGLTDYGDDFLQGRNPYLLAGYGGYKKYYGNGIHAVKENGQMVQIFQMGWERNVEYNSEPKLWEKKIIDPSQFEKLSEESIRTPEDY